jgi:hypothetical protein
MADHQSEEAHPKDAVEMPAPSSWPMVIAFGITLLGTGLVTHWVISLIGFIITARAAVGWWRQVIPHEAHEFVPVRLPAEWPEEVRISGRSVAMLQVGVGHHRMRIPEQVHPYTAGVWGGIAGGIAMAVLACAYGLVVQHSLWYPVNLLAAMVIPTISQASDEALRSFNGPAFGVAVVAHAIVSILVGVLYAVTLPMFPRRAPLWAGFLAPLFWTGLIAETLNLTNPALQKHVNWIWFIVCQFGFGMVAGFVAAKTQRIDTMQHLPFVERAGFEGQFRENPPDEENR